MSCRHRARCARHGSRVHVDGRAEITICLPAACKPGHRVRREIRALQSFGKLQRLGRVLFHGTDIEQEEACSRQRQHELTPGLNLLRMQVIECCI